jgi:uncharacterized membrane protein
MPNPFGETPIVNPLEESYGDVYSTQGGGLIGLLSNVFMTLTIAGGLFMIVNIVLAGFIYIASGSDPKQTALAWQKIYMSLLGLVIMVAAYAIAGVVSYVLFGNANAILSPKIYGPGAIETP